MESTQFERLYLKYAIENPDYLHKINPEFFRIKEFQQFFKVIKSFFERYNKVPTKKQFEHLLIAKKMTDKISNEVLNELSAIGYSLSKKYIIRYDNEID